MSTGQQIYVCPSCFQICETRQECHGHAMICCDTGHPGDERRKPLTDARGELISCAPRWFLEAVGWMQARGHYTAYHP